MRILQVNCVYKEGSTGKIVACISDELLAQGHEVLTCYGNGSSSYDEYALKVCSKQEHIINAMLGRVRGIPFGGLYLSNYRIERTIRSFNPDVVHIHCINGYMVNVYSLLKYLAKNHIKTVLTLHAEIFHTAGCGHAYECEKWKTQCGDCESYKQRVGSWFVDRSKTSWMKMYNAVNSFAEEDLIVTAVSPWLAERAKQSAIMRRYRVVCVMNGLDTSVFHYREATGILDKHGKEKAILFVTPCYRVDEFDIKGGRFIIPIAEALSNYQFIIVASRIASASMNLPSNVQLWGKAKNQEELARLYSEADMTLLLSRRETFSMVTAESLCCGTTVVGFRAGGPESIAPSKYSIFVQNGGVNQLIEEMRQISTNSEIKKIISKLSSELFSSEQMYKGYLQVYQTFDNDLKGSNLKI